MSTFTTKTRCTQGMPEAFLTSISEPVNISTAATGAVLARSTSRLDTHDFNPVNAANAGESNHTNG